MEFAQRCISVNWQLKLLTVGFLTGHAWTNNAIG